MRERLFICRKCGRSYAVFTNRSKCPSDGGKLVSINIPVNVWETMAPDEKQRVRTRVTNSYKIRFAVLTLIAIFLIGFVAFAGIKYKDIAMSARDQQPVANNNSDENVLREPDILNADEDTNTVVAQEEPTDADSSIVENDGEEESLTYEEQYIAYLNDIIIPKEGFISDTDMSADYCWRGERIDVCDFSGQVGIIGYKYVDLDKDGKVEMLVIKRSVDVVPDDNDLERISDDIAVWTTSFNVLYMKNGEIKQTDDYILSRINGVDEGNEFSNYRPKFFEVRMFLKELESCFEIAGSGEYGSPLWADGINIDYVVYAYKEGSVTKIEYNSYSGSDGLNDNGDFSKSAHDAGMDLTAKYWDEYNMHNDSDRFLVPMDEPNCIDLVHVETEAAFEDAFYDGSKISLDDYTLKANTTTYLSIDGIKNTEEPFIFKAEKEKESQIEKNEENIEGEFTTIYGSKYMIPQGFKDITQKIDGYERNNAAGGYTYQYFSDTMGMEIDVSESLWTNYYDENDPELVLRNEYEYFKSYYDTITEPDGKSFSYSYETDEEKSVFVKIIIDDTYYHELVFEYPINNKAECLKKAEEFINSFSIVR